MVALKRGFSLLEAVIALVVLVGAFAALARIMHAGLDQGARADQQAMASLLARERLAEMRAFAREPDQFELFLASYGNVTAPDPGQPEYSVAIRSQAQTLYSPCSTLESPFLSPTDATRKLTASAYKVQVKVSWTRGEFTLVSTIAEPRRPGPYRIQFTQTPPAVLARDATAPLAAELLDGSDRVIADVFFNWASQPVSGNANISTQSRDGSSAEIQNFNPLGLTQYTGGVARGRVVARYLGQRVNEETTGITLSP